MWKSRINTKQNLLSQPVFHWLRCFLLLTILTGLLIGLGGCKEAAEYEYETTTFFLPNDRGTWTYGEAVMPVMDEPCPLVFLAHGFKGTRNSGGAKELSQRLAANGIGAVRIDFNPYLAENLDGGQLDQYTLKTMEADALMAMEYCMNHFSVDGDRLGVYGRSMGGRVAMILGNESSGGYDFKAMTLIAPAGNESAMVYYMGGLERWEDMKDIALKDGFCEKQGLNLTYDWFTSFEAYNPAKTGHKFGDKPVLVFYNTLDTVVLPETSLECASGYENVTVVEVTTEDGHGYEMGWKESSLKEEIMDQITKFFIENL